MDTLIIRPFQPDDWPRMAAIHDAARLRELRLAGLEAAFLPLEIAAEREDLFSYTVVVAERSGEVLAFAAWTEEELAWLYVDPAAARQGIGRALVRRFLEENPGRPVSIEVLAGNGPALALYRSMGFQTVDTRTGSMPGNEGFRVTVHVLERGISPGPPPCSAPPSS